MNNFEDIIDSRDVINRISELVDERDEWIDEQEADVVQDEEWAEEYPEESEELDALEALADEASASPDWQHGEALIRDSYFETYAQELAEEIGAVNPSAAWPNNYIDWERAAEALQMDYMRVEFDGIDYWIRA